MSAGDRDEAGERRTEAVVEQAAATRRRVQTDVEAIVTKLSAPQLKLAAGRAVGKVVRRGAVSLVTSVGRVGAAAARAARRYPVRAALVVAGAGLLVWGMTRRSLTLRT